MRERLRPVSAATADGPFTELDARRLGVLRRFFVQHPVFTDAVVALWYALPATVTALVVILTGHPGPGVSRGWVLMLFAVLGGLVLLRRRREPVLTVVGLVVLVVGCLLVTGETGGYELALALGMYAVAAARSPGITWFVELGAMLTVGTAIVILLRGAATDATVEVPGLRIATIAAIAIGTLIAIAIGVSVRGRRQHIDALIQRANALAHDRAQGEALAVAEERTRIARELHDVVAHSLTVMVALADGARAASASDPEGAGRALDALTETGRSALADMRRVLGVLREPGDDAPLAPDPTTDVDELVETFRATGMPVRVVRSGTLDALPAPVQRSLWRIAQESLTNVLRYAPGSPLVLVEFTRLRDAAGDRVELRITNHAGPLAVGSAIGSGTGRGIIGMRERAAAHGGTVDTGPHERGWQVHAVLPLEETREAR